MWYNDHDSIDPLAIGAPTQGLQNPTPAALKGVFPTCRRHTQYSCGGWPPFEKLSSNHTCDCASFSQNFPTSLPGALTARSKHLQHSDSWQAALGAAVTCILKFCAAADFILVLSFRLVGHTPQETDFAETWYLSCGSFRLTCRLQLYIRPCKLEGASLYI